MNLPLCPNQHPLLAVHITLNPYRWLYCNACGKWYAVPKGGAA